MHECTWNHSKETENLTLPEVGIEPGSLACESVSKPIEPPKLHLMGQNVILRNWAAVWAFYAFLKSPENVKGSVRINIISSK